MQALIQNNKGMACPLMALAYGPGDSYNKKVIYAADLAGAITAVKALWASVCSGSPIKTFGIGANYRVFRGDKEAHYRSFVSQPLPNVTHYHVLPEPRADADYFVLTSLTCESKERGLYDTLRLYTPHPVLPDWSDKLFKLGISYKYQLITSLDMVGMDWAYRVGSVGWDLLIDEAAKAGEIEVTDS